MIQSNGHAPNVCFLLEALKPIVNGTAIHTMFLGEKLARLGSQVTVITRKVSPEAPSYEHQKGIHVIRVKPAIGVKRIGKYLMALPAWLALFQVRKKYDVIIVCDLKVLGIVGVLGAKLFGKKCLLNGVSCGEMDGSYAIKLDSKQPSKIKLGLIRILVVIRNWLLKQSDGFISISSSITREFYSAGVPTKYVKEITCGIDFEHFVPSGPSEKIEVRKQLGLSVTGRKYFLYTGRLAKGKGLENLVKVWKGLVCDYKNIHLLLIGSGQGYSVSCEEYLKSYVQRNFLETTVTFTGNVADVRMYLQAGDFFLLPSESEALGLSLLEAMACGLPCIATNVGGILDIIQHNVNGILVPYGDQESLEKGMRRLLDHEEEVKQLGKNARKTIEERFNLDREVEQYISLISSLSQ